MRWIIIIIQCTARLFIMAIPYLCITLSSAKQRQLECKLIFQKWNLNVEFIDGIQDKNPVYGCWLSHLYCIQLAKFRGYPYVAILEDDVEFDQQPPKTIHDLEKKLINQDGNIPVWDMIYLGYNVYRGYRYNPHFIRLVCGLTTHAYIVHSSMYDEILNGVKTEYMKIPEFQDLQAFEHIEMQTYHQVIDVFYAKYIHHRRKSSFGMFPIMAHQRMTASNSNPSKMINQGIREELVHHASCFEYMFESEWAIQQCAQLEINFWQHLYHRFVHFSNFFMTRMKPSIEMINACIESGEYTPDQYRFWIDIWKNLDFYSPTLVKIYGDPVLAYDQEWKKLTQNKSGRWHTLQLISRHDVRESDIDIVINDQPILHPKKTIVLDMEPSMFLNKKRNMDGLLGSISDHPSSTLPYRNTIEWHVTPDVFTAISTTVSKQDELDDCISTVVSGKVWCKGHVDRIRFVTALDEQLKNENSFQFHVFGNHQLSVQFSKGPLPRHAKDVGIFPYRYTLAIENQAHQPGYFTEKLIDCIIGESLCFYYGDTVGLPTYLDSRAWIPIDIHAPISDTVQLIKTVIQNKEWEKRISIIRKMKHRIMTQLQALPTLARLLRHVHFNCPEAVFHVTGGFGNVGFQVMAAMLLTRASGHRLILYVPPTPHGNTLRPPVSDYPWFRHLPIITQLSDRQQQYPIVHEPMMVPSSSIQVMGYFQESRFFQGRTCQLRDELVQHVRKELVENWKQKYERYAKGKPTIVMDVRRGDYVKLNVPLCQEEYYNSALRQFSHDCQILICTDDIKAIQPWKIVKQPNVTMMDDDPQTKFGIMMHADHFILANSSFSHLAYEWRWKRDAKVIVPFPWYKDEGNVWNRFQWIDQQTFVRNNKTGDMIPTHISLQQCMALGIYISNIIQ